MMTTSSPTTKLTMNPQTDDKRERDVSVLVTSQTD
jgi:hypothetical protein